MKPIYMDLPGQNTLVLYDEAEPDDNPIAALVGGCIGPIANTADHIVNADERQAFLWGVVEGLRHAENVLKHGSVFGVRQREDDE